jgi:hypothetical protein
MPAYATPVDASAWDVGAHAWVARVVDADAGVETT